MALYNRRVQIQGHQYCPNPPRLGIRYVDYTSLMNRQGIANISSSILNPLTHISNLPWKTSRTMASCLFWQLFFPGPSNTPITSVYKKPTHREQNLQWHICHNLSAKYSVFNTLAHRARIVCTFQQLLNEEKDHIRKALLRCSYPTWALIRIQTNTNHWLSDNQVKNIPEDIRLITTTTPATTTSTTLTKLSSAPRDWVKNSRIFVIKWEYRLIFKGQNTIRNLPVVPKEKDNITNKSGAIYRFNCVQAGGEEEYTG